MDSQFFDVILFLCREYPFPLQEILLEFGDRKEGDIYREKTIYLNSVLVPKSSLKFCSVESSSIRTSWK